jgi:hypothetical protein
MRINSEENDYIFTQQPRAQKPSNTKIVNYYTILGDHDFIDQDNRPRANDENNVVVAKSIETSSNKKFFIKIGTYGKVFNPIGMFSEGKNNKFLAKIGRKEWEFKEVNQKIFDLYLNFLTTKNIAWLNNAERELS